MGLLIKRLQQQSIFTRVFDAEEAHPLKSPEKSITSKLDLPPKILDTPALYMKSRTWSKENNWMLQPQLVNQRSWHLSCVADAKCNRQQFSGTEQEK